MSNFDLSIHFFLQLAAILTACRAVGWVARRFGQTQVVGEMIAGVTLGPSLFGLMPAEVQACQTWLFPPKSVSMTIIYAVAQVGLVLYMFVVGVELRTDLLFRRIRSAASVSIAGMVVPFCLGSALAIWFVRDAALFSQGVTIVEAMLFLGASMSITAFPMLARIIYERGLTGTNVGTLALAAGSLDDAAAWCVLAVVLASFKANASIALLAIGGGVAYALVVLLIIRPLLRPLGSATERRGSLSPHVFALILLLLMVAAWYTDRIGIYAVFGAFILGAAMPRGLLCRELERMISPLATNLLLPLFFVYSGLNTRIDMVDSWGLWGLTAIVLTIACAGKGLACFAAARLNGESPRDSVAIGALMNARGLMELIILNIGLEKGLITPQLFSIMVMMAIVTTLMATPIFELAYGRENRPRVIDVAVAT